MKKQLYLLSLFILLLSSVSQSCDDFDVPSKDRFDDEKVWKNEQLILGALANLYDGLQFEHYPSYWEDWLPTYNINMITVSDEGVGAYQAGELNSGDIARVNFGDEWFDWWKKGYSEIRACNVFLKKIESADILTAESKRAYNAEVRFLRAFHYFTLAKRYGGVPLIIEPQEYKGIDDLGKLQVPRNKEQVIWDFIIQEVDLIASDLPTKRDKDNRARVGRYAAYALQSRAALYAGSIAKYGTVDLNGLVGIDKNRTDTYWKKSIIAADSIILNSHHSLYQAHEDKVTNFRNMFLEKDLDKNPEYIFWKEFIAVRKGHSFDLFNVPFSFTQNGYGCGCNPTLDLIEAFEYKDGSSGKLRLKNASGDYIKYKSPLDLFKDKDPRLKATFYLPYDECRGGIVEIRRGIYDESKSEGNRFITKGNPDDMYEANGKRMKVLGKDGVWDTGDVGKTGFYTKKFADETVKNLSEEYFSDVPWPIFRMAEIYLNKAEAAFELGKISDAVGAINKVRKRAGIKELNTSEITLDRIRNERRVELAYESQRHWDLKRWRIAHIALADFETKALYPWYVWQDGKFIFTTGKAPKPNKVFQQKNYYLKIKDSDMSTNPKLGPNNPGF